MTIYVSSSDLAIGQLLSISLSSGLQGAVQSCSGTAALWAILYTPCPLIAAAGKPGPSGTREIDGFRGAEQPYPMIIEWLFSSPGAHIYAAAALGHLWIVDNLVHCLLCSFALSDLVVNAHPFQGPLPGPLDIPDQELRVSCLAWSGDGAALACAIGLRICVVRLAGL